MIGSTHYTKAINKMRAETISGQCSSHETGWWPKDEFEFGCQIEITIHSEYVDITFSDAAAAAITDVAVDWSDADTIAGLDMTL